MERLLCFVAVNFVNDPLVAGFSFWYWCEFRETKVGDHVIAPLGNHNRLQEGVVVGVIFRTEDEAPFPFERIKRIVELKENQNAQKIKRRRIKLRRL